MIRNLQLPKTYISKFIQKEPGDPFQLLLDDKGEPTNYFHSFKTRKEKIIEAKKRINQAEAQIEEYTQEISVQEANQARIDTEIANYESEKEAEREISDKVIRLTGEAKKLITESDDIFISTEWSVLSSSCLHQD